MAAAATLPALVSVDEYLHSMYDPDVDYVDGYLEERNVGENQHSEVQAELLTLLRVKGKEWGIRAYPEHRVQVSARRYRVPDVCVMPRSWVRTAIIGEAPMLCIEVLSPEDTFSRTQMKCRDYLEMGVPVVWIFDPEQRVVYEMRDRQLEQVRGDELALRGTAIRLSIGEIFAALDEDA